MNAGVFFQMMNGSNSVSETVSTQHTGTRNCSNESFKKEMDHVFDKKQKTENDVSKNNIASKKNTSSKVHKKDELSNSSKDQIDYEKSDQENEITQEEQMLVAAQIQKNLATVDATVINDDLLQMQSKTTDNPLLETAANFKTVDNLKVLEKASQIENGEVKLPYQNNIDLAKLAILKLSQNDNQNQIAEKFITDNQVQQENGQDSEISFNKELNSQNLETKQEDGQKQIADVPDENVLIKPNNLDLSKVNIKVADVPVDTTRADMAKQLADKILYKLSNGKQEFDLELYPRNLGKVNIKLIVQNGSAEMIMSTSSSKAHHLLSMQADKLRGILDSSLGTNNTVTLKQPETSDGNFDRDNFQEQNNGHQNQQQQRQEKKMNEQVSFIDRLRLGLVDNLEEAV